MAAVRLGFLPSDPQPCEGTQLSFALVAVSSLGGTRGGGLAMVVRADDSAGVTVGAVCRRGLRRGGTAVAAGAVGGTRLGA